MKSKIKNIKLMDKPADKYGKVSSIITFEDNVDGFFNHKAPIEFSVGEEVEYTATKKTSGQGKEYNVLTVAKIFAPTGGQEPAPVSPTKVNVPSTSGIREAKSLAEMKFEARICNMKLAVGCLEAGKFERKDVLEAFAEWNSVFDAAIDEIKPR